jgi:hypothetical protein
MKMALGRAAKWIVLASLPLLATSLAHAQATRTWVSGVGDDVNPCSRTAPCKTFAGAISKTAAGGQINVLDSGGFGALTITKSITINGEGALASVLVAGTNGFVVSAASTDVVVLRNLEIVSAGSPTQGINGILFLTGARLHLEKVTIRQFAGSGVLFTPSGASSLFVTESSMIENAVGGIDVTPMGGTARVQLNKVTLNGNNRGMRAEDGSTVVIQDSTMAGNLANGVVIVSTTGMVDLTLERIVSVNNGTGIRSTGPGSTVRVSNSTVSGNATGLLTMSGGVIRSFGNNHVNGNVMDGAPTSGIPEM